MTFLFGPIIPKNMRNNGNRMPAFIRMPTLRLFRTLFVTSAMLAITAACGDKTDADYSLGDDVQSQNKVWGEQSSTATLYLAAYAEIESADPSSTAPVAVIHADTATPEELASLDKLIYSSPSEHQVIFCEYWPGSDLFYLLVENSDGTSHRYSQSPTCAISDGTGFFQGSVDGHISDEQMCALGNAYGVIGFNCVDGEPVGFSVLRTGSLAGGDLTFTQPLNQVFRDSQALSTFYSELIETTCIGCTLSPLPTVNFDDSIVIFVAHEIVSSGGYSIEISGLKANQETLIVRVLKTSPGSHCAVDAAFTGPYHFYVIDSNFGSVEFLEESLIYDCP